jgi:hypothetical protein
MVEQLPAPSLLTASVARRAAARVAGRAVAASRARQWGRILPGHVLAQARHRVLRDRPIHPPVIAPLPEGMTVEQFRRRERMSEDELERLNPDLDPDLAEAGTPVVLFRYDPDHPGRSQNRPNRGRLVDGELMPDGPGWVVREPRFAWGTPYTIDALIHAVRLTRAAHPGGQTVMVADLSRRRGGRFRPHLSHQSGRDVDVTYHRRTTDEPTFSRTRTSQLDEKRTWAYLRALLTRHDVVYIFLDRRLQVRLYEWAEANGEHPAFLDALFQYGPRDHRNPYAIIRVSPGHHDHYHVRFDCEQTDLRCANHR